MPRRAILLDLRKPKNGSKLFPLAPTSPPQLRMLAVDGMTYRVIPPQFTVRLVPTAPVPFSNPVVIYVVYVDIQLITLKSVFIQCSNNIRGFLSHLNHTVHQNIHHWEKRPYVGFLFFFLLYSIFRIFQMSLHSFFKEEKLKQTLK